MGGYSLNTKSTLFGVPKFLSSSPLSSLYYSRSVDEGCASVSTAAIGSGLTFTALYLAGISDHARLCYGHHSNVFKWFGCLLAFPHIRPTSFKWLDSPSGYVPPKMDLFSDDIAPLGFSSSPFCPIDSAHLERSFDLLRYQHAFKQLGVPSVVNSGIRLVTSSTGSGSHGGTSTDISTDRFGSSRPGATLRPFLDRPRPSRNNGGSNEGSGSGSGRNPSGPPDLTTARRNPSAQRGYKLVRFGPPPPPPPPPPGTSDADDDDSEPGSSSSSDWAITWKTLLLGTFIAHLINKFFPNKKRFPRKGSGQAPPMPFLKSKVDISGLDTDLAVESDAISLPTFVDEVLQIDTDVYVNSNYTERKPVGHSSRLVGNLPHDAFLKQFLTFSAATGKAIIILLLLVSYMVLRKIIDAMSVFRPDSTTTTVQDASTIVVRDDPFGHTVRADTAEPPAPDDDFNIDSTVVFEDAWLANVFQAPVEALDAPVEDSDIEPAVIAWATDVQAPVEAFDAPVEDSNVDTTAFSEHNSFWITESQAPVEAQYAPVEDSDIEINAFSEDDSFWDTESQPPVEAYYAPVEDFDVDTTALSENDSFGTESSMNEYSSVPDHYDVKFDDDATPRMTVKQTCVEAPALQCSSDDDDDDDGDDDDDQEIFSDCVQMADELPATKSFSKVVALDSFKWDRHGSFKCSTPLTRLEALPESGSFDYGRCLSEESADMDIPVPDSDIANTTATLQELEKTKKNLDTIIEAQIKRAESTYKPRLDSHLQVRNVTQRSLSSSIWASSPGPSSDSFIEAQIKRVESTCSNKPRFDRFDSQLQVRNQSQHSLSSSIWASTPGPSSNQDDRFVPTPPPRLNPEARVITILPRVPNSIDGTPGPDIQKTQQAPGRRRRRRQRGRNHGRGPSDEQSGEEDGEGELGDVSSDVPNWALA